MYRKGVGGVFTRRSTAMLSLDVSKATLACALFHAPARQPHWEGEVPNTPAGVAQLLARTAPEQPWVLEPTGRYSTTVAKQARAAGRTVLLASPRKAKKYWESIQSRAKTDRLEARGLGLYALTHELPPYPLKTAEVERLEQLLAARRGVVQSLSSLRQQQRALPYAAAALQPALDALQAQVKALDQQIQQAQHACPAAQQLRPVPGIGPVTAAAVGACLTAKQCAHADQFVAYVGLDVGVRRSGKRQSDRSPRGLTKQGDAYLRRLLYMCARSAVRAKHSPFRAQFERERAKGLPKVAAYCAVARKLARLCWSLVQHDTRYDAERVLQPRISAAPIDKNHRI